ncbi:hypothetical protein [Urechidicola croceus]|uniref:Uncharacterized protein n=1 Tax=Urechidicola croceus TaxID=1850246 RepID=A0A1D8P9Y1_9FLAO|nr:hypothetical protein [Urechidicola croceus]AOW21400.1 hypothetical protein LPB138_12240 [Urechidicola croceus]
MKKGLLIFLLFSSIFSFGQKESNNFRFKKITVEKDSVFIDSVSINPFHFKVLTDTQIEIDSTEYTIDFAKSLLIIDKEKYPIIEVEYYAYPEFLTKTYFKFDKKLIVPNATNNSNLYSLTTNRENNFFKPFDGLNTSGSISRGLTVGNNQDAVLNSTLDLQIAGKLSDKVTLRASITDTNIPIQENGYTQQLNEFDRVFIELFSDNWSIKAGDVNLETSNTYFGNFTKKVAGISLGGVINHSDSKTTVFASGALVRGKFTNYTFTGQENNQGPYRLFGPNNEQYIIIISGSETVYVNGLPLERGENNDYIIDYNTAEITFTPTYPINANMRISVDFQFSDRNYTRFITHDGATYESEKFSIGGSFYSENDAKNQPLQQDLSDDQKQLLSNAGNDTSLMVAPSAVADSYTEGKILYRKEFVGSEEIFVFSNNPDDELFNVRFSNVGTNQGDYELSSTIANGRVYEYVGVNSGNYAPVIQLIAPNKLQLAIVHASYNPTEKTNVNAEIGLSQNDQNLFSSIDDDLNDGIAAKIGLKQTLIDKNWDLKTSINFESITDNFESIQRFRNVEFNRDWNILNPLGDQQLLNATLGYSNDENGIISYNFEQLKFSDSFDGNRHNVFANLHFDNLKINLISSLLKSISTLEENNFNRLNANAKYNFKKSWIGTKINSENNKRIEKSTQNLSPLSQRFNEYEAFFGIGDTTKVFSEIGYNYRLNDSTKSNSLERVSNSKTYYINSQLIQNKDTKLSLYANYRTVDNVDFEDTKSLNSRIIFNKQLFNRIISLNTVYETVSGNLPQQEFTYIEVEQGQGFYTWIDYNNDNIQDLNEFEIAQFQDEASYLRVALPSLNYIQTHQTKFSQSLNLNPQQWSNKSGVKKILSFFQNQSFILIDNKQKRDNDKFNLNPFNVESDDLLGLNYNLKNSLFFNRGKQRYSTTYNYINSKNKTSLVIDNLENKLNTHQLQFIHKMGDFWLLDLKGSSSKNTNSSENYSTRNYELNNKSINPKLSYIYNQNKSLDLFYEYKTKDNIVGNMESLESHKLGASFRTSNNKSTSFNAELNFFINKYTGNQNSPVAYQMLEGLQDGNNFTWSLLWQQKLTSYLDLNFSYLGRKSETSKTIHTGTVQLRANF